MERGLFGVDQFIRPTSTDKIKRPRYSDYRKLSEYEDYLIFPIVMFW